MWRDLIENYLITLSHSSFSNLIFFLKSEHSIVTTIVFNQGRDLKLDSDDDKFEHGDDVAADCDDDD